MSAKIDIGGAELYIAVLLAESSSDAASYVPLYEESFVLVRAGSLEEATVRAEELGRSEQAAFRNEYGETVSWSLKHVVDVAPLLNDELGNGSVLYARHFRDYNAYRRMEPRLDGNLDGDR